MKLKTKKFLISQSKHLTAKYANYFSTEKLIKYKNLPKLRMFLLPYKILHIFFYHILLDIACFFTNKS